MSLTATPVRLGPLFAGLLFLAGCGSAMDGIGSTLLTGGSSKAEGLSTDDLLARPVCPPTEIKHGTESMLVYEPGKHGNPEALRFQASVQRVARECTVNGDQMAIRVGAAGRVAAGPKGAQGIVQVPVRIAAVKDDQVIYTKLHTVAVDVRAPDFSALWTQVDDTVVIPSNGSASTTIYVGLDEVGSKAPAGKKKK